MAKITDENDNLIGVEELRIGVPRCQLNRIFELAVRIDQIEVRYQADPLRMANEAIQLMQGYASEIAALAGYHEDD